MAALIFDCDGVLVDTEKSGHLRAFNRMWQEFEIPWSWSEEEYSDKLRISGGKERLESLRHDLAFCAAWPIPSPETAWLRTVEQWHRRKTDIYLDIIRGGDVCARPGVRRLAQEAFAAGWGLAVASSGARQSVHAVLEHVMGEQLASSFHVLSGESVSAKKPAPDVYTLAAAAVGQAAHCCIVIEDSGNGLMAARAAGMTCVITTTGLSPDWDFSGAAMVVSSLGEPNGTPSRVLSQPSTSAVTDHVRLQDLAQLLDLETEHAALYASAAAELTSHY